MKFGWFEYLLLSIK